MKSKSFAGMACSIAGALEAIGDRWAFLILRDLALGLSRYDDLQRSTGIPTTTLAERLKHLENAGLIAKVQYQTHPPRGEYLLTSKGRDARPVLLALMQWGDRWDLSGAGAPPIVFVDGEMQRPVRLALVDAETGAMVQQADLVAREGVGADDLVRWRLDMGHRANAATSDEPSA
jgi:DNA-binding HxlR family transcriptional regulator